LVDFTRALEEWLGEDVKELKARYWVNFRDVMEENGLAEFGRKQ